MRLSKRLLIHADKVSPEKYGVLSVTKLPKRVRVAAVLAGRYQPGEKPLSWDDRSAGVEQIRTADGDTITLYSSGGQSTPAPGWELLLTKERAQPDDNKPALLWTLYGIGKSA